VSIPTFLKLLLWTLGIAWSLASFFKKPAELPGDRCFINRFSVIFNCLGGTFASLWQG